MLISVSFLARLFSAAFKRFLYLFFFVSLYLRFVPNSIPPERVSKHGALWDNFPTFSSILSLSLYSSHGAIAIQAFNFIKRLILSFIFRSFNGALAIYFKVEVMMSLNSLLRMCTFNSI